MGLFAYVNLSIGSKFPLLGLLRYFFDYPPSLQEGICIFSFYTCLIVSYK